MKILFLAHRIPYPPNKGDKIRSFNELKHLSRNHAISLVCLADDKKDLQYREELKKYCSTIDVIPTHKTWAKLKSLCYLIFKKPLSLAYFSSNAMKKAIDYRQSTVDYDLIFCFSSSMAQYVMNTNHIPKVMDFVDVDSDKWRQYACYTRRPFSWIYRLEARRLQRYEKQISDTFQHAVFVSDKEVEIFKTFASDALTTAIPNGVDLQYFDRRRTTDDRGTMINDCEPLAADSRRSAVSGLRSTVSGLQSAFLWWAHPTPSRGFRRR